MYFVRIVDREGNDIDVLKTESRDEAEYNTGKIHSILQHGGFRGTVHVETHDDDAHFDTEMTPEWLDFPDT